MIVCPLHLYFRTAHLDAVVATMRERGRPTLRGHVFAGVVLLAEGTHRIRAALQLGLVPCIRDVPWWRSPQALTNAGFAAVQRGLWFDELELVCDPAIPAALQPSGSGMPGRHLGSISRRRQIPHARRDGVS